MPPIALAVSFVWLSEVPGPVELAGGALTVAGVVLINRRARRDGRAGSEYGAGRAVSAKRARVRRHGPAVRAGPFLTRRRGC